MGTGMGIIMRTLIKYHVEDVFDGFFGDMVPGHHLISGESKYTIPHYDIEGVVLTKLVQPENR